MSKPLDNLGRQLGRLLPRRIRLLYLILGVLLALSVVPLAFYGYLVSSSTRDKLQTNEQILQVTVTRGTAREIRLYVLSMDMQMENLVRWLESTGTIVNVADPKHADGLRRATEGFVRAAPESILFLTIVNAEQRGIAGGDPEVGTCP